MARLPQTLDGVQAPVAERPSLAVAPPTDYGLSDLAAGLSKVAQAKQLNDAREASQILQRAQADFEPRFAERAAGYDGRESGFAAQQLASFDNHFTPIAGDPSYSQGVRLALRQQIDMAKAQFGQRAISVEGEKRAGVIADQQRVVDAQQQSVGLATFQSTFAPGYQQLTDSLDGSTNDHVDKTMALFDQSAQAAVEATPEAARPGLQMKLAALRASQMAQAWDAQDKAHDAYVVNQVKTASTATTNAVLSNPAAYDLASQTAPDVAAGLPKALQQTFTEEYQGQLASARVEGLILKGDLSQAKAELEDGRYDKFLPAPRKQALLGAVKSTSAEQARQMIEALRYGADVDPASLASAAKLSGDVGLQAHADYAVMVGEAEPGAIEAMGAGVGKAGFREASTFVIDNLEGGDALVANDGGKGPTRFGINQTANPDVDVPSMTRPQAVARYKRYWAAVGADRLPPALALVAFDTAVNQGPDTARAMLAQSGGDVGRFLALREQSYRQLAQQPGHAGDLDGWMGRLAKVRDQAARLQAFQNVQDGLSSDPIKFALGSSTRTPLAAVPPLPDQPTGPAFQAALKGRLAVGQMMNTTYRAPLRLLTDAEAAQYKDLITRDPMQGIALASEALQAVGPVAARSLLGEVGLQGQAGVELHLADLAAAGLGDFSHRAAVGLALKAKGAKLKPADDGAIAAELDSVRGIFAGQPELRLIAQQTAEAAMIADQQSGSGATAHAYVNAALGASSRGGRLYGGLARVNGADTVLPPWLAVDHADDALDHLAQGWEASKTGPVYTDGSAIPADKLRRMRMQLLPSGNYRLIDGQGRAMLNRVGRAFEFDLDKARDGLRQILGPRGVIQQSVR